MKCYRLDCCNEVSLYKEGGRVDSVFDSVLIVC